MRKLIEQRVLKTIETNHYEFPCGFEIMMKEENLTLPERFIGKDWEEDPTWITKVIDHVPNMSDELLLQIWEQFLCLEFR